MSLRAAVRSAVEVMQACEALLAAAARLTNRLVDELQLFRRAGMLLAFYVTYSSIEFCYLYAKANTSADQLVGVAAVIGAIMTPVGLMQSALFKFYVDSSTYRFKRQREAEAAAQPPHE